MLENPNWSIDPERMRERRNRPAIETYPGLFPREMVEEHQRNASARRSEERLYASLRKKGLSDGEIAANLERVRRVIENGARK